MRCVHLLFVAAIAAGCDRADLPTAAAGPEVLAAKGPAKPAAILFESDRTGVREIWKVNRDASGLEQLTFFGENAHPAWSPNGKKVVFTSFRDDGGGEIYVMNADGRNQRRLTTRPGADTHPDWSPDGTRIAFTSDVAGDLDIIGMNADGTNWTALAMFSGSQEFNPRWSPDGQYIAYLSDRQNSPGTYDIWIAFVGYWAKPLTTTGVTLQTLTWSTDGTKVLFYGATPITGIYAVDRETAQVTLRKDTSSLGSGVLFGFSLSPDGSQMTYGGQTVGMSFIGAVGMSGVGNMILTQSHGGNINPVWSP